MPTAVYNIISLIATFLAVVVVLSFHEFAHAHMAVKNGDPTPRLYHRYTLNPVAHFDLLGLLCFLFARFGWAKPVPINPGNFRHYKKGLVEVSLAGVVMNYIMAFVAFPLYALCLKYLPDMLLFDELITFFFEFVFILSLNFCVFNFLPLYPLDGFRLVDALSTRRGKVYMFLRNYGQYILLGLVLLSILADMTGFVYIDLLGWFMQFATNILGWPITALWGLIF